VRSNGIQKPWTISKRIKGFEAADSEEAKHPFIYLLVHSKDPMALLFLGETLVPNKNPYRTSDYEKLKEYNDAVTS